jgi:hypothetical protein
VQAPLHTSYTEMTELWASVSCLSPGQKAAEWSLYPLLPSRDREGKQPKDLPQYSLGQEGQESGNQRPPWDALLA